MNVSQLQSNNGSLIVEGAIFDRNCRMTVDTGASRTFVKPSVIAAWRVEPTATCYKLLTATGETAPVHGICNVEIQLGRQRIEHPALVADIIDDVILGLDFLQSKKGVVLDLESGVLRLGDEEIIMSSPVNRDAVLRVVVKEDTVLLPEAETVVPAVMDGNTSRSLVGVVEPAEDIGDKGILIARTLVNIRSKLTFARVANLQKYEQKLEKGTVIGVCEAVKVVRKCEGNKPTVRPSTLPDALDDLFKKACKNLDTHEVRKVKSLLIDFQDVFSLSDADYGRTKITQHRIETGEHRPIKQPPRRVPLAKQGEVDIMLEDMQRQGVIEQADSPWSSPVVLVKKKDGSTRFCVDYRKLNDVTKKDSYPLPRIDDTLDTLAGSKWFTTLDLKSGYWQVELDPKDKEKTAFSTGKGLWLFTVMPFGLCNATATFERLMDTVLRDPHWKTCLVYLDNIIIFGKTLDEHLKNLRGLLENLRAANLKPN